MDSTDSTARVTGIAEEYRSFRNGEAAVPLEGWTVIHLAGPDTAAFLQGLASQDLGPGSSRRTYFLTEKGRPLALAWVRVGEDGATAWVVADEGARESLLPHFERFRIMEEVEFRHAGAELEVLGVAAATTAGILPAEGSEPAGLVRLHADPLSILLVPSPDAAGIPRVHPSAFEPWRLEAGLPRTGIDFDLDRIVTELNDPDAVSLTKGCYVGQEVVARTSNRGQVRRRRVVFRFGSWPGPLPPRTEIRAGDVSVGFLTSSAPIPGSPEGVGMGYISTETLAQGPDLLTVQGPTTIPISVLPSGGTALT
jgi:folate-binding protein YgfZ